MKTVELVIASLRRSAILIGKNIWLLGWAFLYAFTAPLFMLGGTGLPVLFWWLGGRYFEPTLLFSDPLAFILGHMSLILFALAGFTVGFVLYLLVMLFYYGALTGVAARGFAPGNIGAEKVRASTFFEEGARMFSPGLTSIALVSLLPLLPMAVLLLLVVVISFKLAALVSGTLDISTPWVLICIVLTGISGFLTLLTSWIAFLWYKFSIAASRVENLDGRAATGRAWSFFKARWKLVVCYVVALLLLAVLSWGVTAPFSMGGKMLDGVMKPLGVALQIVAVPLGVVLTLFIDLWTRCALVALFIDNR
jgi:hypothetical protein